MAAVLPYVAAIASAYFASQGQEDTNTANRENSQAQMDFQERMSNTAHQREVKDLIAAGLNPMLSAKLGGATTPSGAMSVNQNPAAAGSKAAAESMQGAGAGVQIQNVQANTDLANANTAKALAEEKEIIARTPTHGANIEATHQGIAESKARIDNIAQQIRTGGATEDNIRQQSENLKELVPQIRAQVEQIRSVIKLQGEQTNLARGHTALAAAQTGLAGAQTSETTQRTAANLPALEAALGNLERVSRQMAMPAKQNSEAYHSSASGTIMDAIQKVKDALNPFGGIMANVTRAPAPTPQPDRHGWKK